MRRSHTKAFLSVCTVVDERILCEMEVIKLNHLHEIYISELENTKYSNDNYKSGKLKAKLIKQYEGQLSFQALRLPTGIYESDLVYNSSTDVGKVVEQAYLLGMEDQTKNVALTLRTCVQRAYKDSTPLPWPPTARDLENLDITLPKELKKFLEFLITGKRIEKISPQNSRLVESIGLNLCRAVTNGHWKMPKHILLSMTLRHLFRSDELTNLVNRFGHCENYSFSLELETAQAHALKEASDVLSSQIIRNPILPSVFHSDFDNVSSCIYSL